MTCEIVTSDIMNMPWMESIVECGDRESAREKFQDWCEMMESVHDGIKFAGRQNDVARLHITTDDNYFARDLPQHYGSGACPLRVIDVKALNEEQVELGVLLADLRVNHPHKTKQSPETIKDAIAQSTSD